MKCLPQGCFLNIDSEPPRAFLFISWTLPSSVYSKIVVQAV